MSDLITYRGAERQLYIDPQEARYAVIAKDGPYYTVRVKFPDRDNGYGLFWRSELLERRCPSRAAARALCDRLGFTVVSSWRQARRDHQSRIDDQAVEGVQ